jgi:serine/threonine-protein kinase HipA
MNGEKVGLWSFTNRGSQEFSYDPAWLATNLARPISLSMPLRPASEPYRGERVEAFFDNLLPDNRRIRERLQRRFQTPTADAFDLLNEIGRDCVGALQLLPLDQTPQNVRTITGERLTSAAIERHLSALLDPAIGQQLTDGEEAFRISIAGAQEKTALLWHEKRWHLPLGTTPSTHIFKLPMGIANQGIDLSTSVENEWLCAQIVREFGLPIANCAMAQFGRYKVLIVERFDRRLSTDGRWWVRLPQEDLCQATGTPSSMKYESDGGPGIRRITDLLLGSSQAESDRGDFLRAQLVFWLLCAIDAHAKNFSLALEAGGTFRLTPLYDVLSAHPVLGNSAGKLSPRKVRMAMAVEGNSRHYKWNDIQPRHWRETAKRCGMQSVIDSIIEGVLKKVPEVIATVGREIPKDFPASVADSVLSGVEKAAKRFRIH